MTTIKSYTDLEQSRKLAEILPLESADMYWKNGISDKYIQCFTPFVSDEYRTNVDYDYDVPCWSLAALLGVLPIIIKGKDNANPFIAKTPDNEYYVVYATLTKEIDSSGIYDNPIDACYEMIIKLYGLKMLLL